MASLQTYINQTSERYGLTAAQSQALSSAYESGPVREVYNTASALPAVPEGGGSAVLYQGTSPINGLPNYENAAEYIRETPGTFMDNMTPAGQYLSGEAQGTLANAENAINQALSNIGEQNLPLGALSEPAWREVSTNLVTEAESISKVFPSEMPNPNSVFMQNELTTALELHPEIAGIPAEQLRNLPPNELANLFNSGATPVEPFSSERPSLANILAAGGLGVAGILGSIINAAFVGEAKAPERPYDPPQVGTGDPASRPDPLQQPDPNQFHAPQTYTNYYGGSYATQAEADHAQDDHQDAADNTGDNGPKGEPIILDLTGNGIKITQKSQSGMFFDMAGDGYQHHTAWAGAGNGVLVLDIGNTGKITQQNQVVFTKWDPTATNDMQALRDVFDTNHNGKLDAGDAHYADFKILVTNADGTMFQRAFRHF